MKGTVLVIAAHPDDPEFGAGGTIAKWVEEGREVIYAVCTDGDKGSNDPEMTPERLAQIRRQEQREAAAVLGVKEVVFLGYPDGGLEDTPQFRGELVALIRKYRPETVLTADPYRRYMWHRDHRIAGSVAMDAVYPYARDRLSYPEHQRLGLQPHRVREVYFWAAEEPNAFIDVTATWERKMRAARCHKSQLRGDFNLEGWLRKRAEDMAKGRDVTLVEAFYRLEIPF